MKYIIIDIDGTICQKHPDRDINDLDKVHLDIPITPVLRVVETLCNHDDVFPIFITARGEDSREVTAKWLKNTTNLYFGEEGYCLGEKGNLYMNQELGTLRYASGVSWGDDIPVTEKHFVIVNAKRDAEIKQQLLNQFLKDYNTTKDSILSVFEDNKECIEMYRKEGLFVFDVNQGR